MKKYTPTLILLSILLSTYHPRVVLAQESNNNAQLQSALDAINEQKKQRQSDIESLRSQSSSLIEQLEQSKEKAVHNQLTIAEIESHLVAVDDHIKILEAEQRNLIKSLYIAHNRSNVFITFIISGNLSSLFENQVYLKHAHTDVRKKAQIQAEEIKKMKIAQASALVEREIILNAIDTTQSELANLKGVITETQNSLKELDKNSREVEAQILALEVPATPKNTESAIVSNSKKGGDVVDFSLSSSLQIIGAGTPHGLGMSQYGAKAMADSGATYDSILTHYYQGTRIKKVDTHNTAIRVKLSASSAGGKLIVRSGQYQNTSTGETYPTGTTIPASPNLSIIPISDDARITVSYKLDRFNTYRGAIRILGDAGSYTTVNELPIEDYLRSVISGEMSASWTQEALKAQAVAARNYAYKNIKPGNAYDLCDTPTCQVYLGTNHEFPSTDQAVAATAGTLLVYGDEIITAYYFSSSGGWTENNENVWGGKPIPWLRGVPSPGEQSPYNQWKVVSLSRSTVEQYLNADADTAVGSVQRIEIIKRGVSGRVMAVKITGSSGEKTVTGKTFKYVINVNLPDGTKDYIKSDLFGFE